MTTATRKIPWRCKAGVIVFVLIFAVWLEPTRLGWGWIRGDAFYDGRPTCYWEQVLKNWRVASTVELNFVAVETRNMSTTFEMNRKPKQIIVYEPTWLTKVVSQFLGGSDPEAPKVLDGDPLSSNVLSELLQHESESIRLLALFGLEEIKKRSQ